SVSRARFADAKCEPGRCLRTSPLAGASGILSSPLRGEPDMTKDDVADALDEIGTLLELKGENAFRTNAYHNAARLVQQLPGDLEQMVAEGKLEEVRGIGEALALKISTLVTTGKLPYLEDLRASIPAGLV